jgi:hypothetical protein
MVKRENFAEKIIYKSRIGCHFLSLGRIELSPLE